MFGICPLCNESKDLAKSHSIPDAFFRYLKNASGGQCIVMPARRQKEIIHRTNDSGAAHLLCVECEQILNKRVDAPGIMFLNRTRKFITGQRDKMPILDLEILTQFVISILWRSSLSSAKMYARFKLHREIEQTIRNILIANRGAKDRFSVKIVNLTDNDSEGGFTAESLTQLIVPPYQLNTKNRKQFKLVIGGFLIIIRTPIVPHVTAINENFVRSKQPRITSCEITMEKELFEHLVYIRGLQFSGRSTVGA